MKGLHRLTGWLVLAAAVNVVWWIVWAASHIAEPLLAGAAGLGIAIACLAGYAVLSVRPTWRRKEDVPRRLTRMMDGYELLLAAGVCALGNAAWWIWLGLRTAAVSTPVAWSVFAGTVVVGLIGICGIALNGFVRLAISSKQMPLSTKVLVLVFWWLPPLTVILLGRSCSAASREYDVAVARLHRDRERASEQICRTRYPLLMVHGVFFRDSSRLNYWGRIPHALGLNGATIHYGEQQSSASVEASAAELAATVERIVSDTGCEKLNVIAHSKGGLDMRYAISRLGIADKVASLTTINTPHRGCNFARKLMEKMPQTAIDTIGARYDAVFSRLGDPDPSFLDGVAGLTDLECARLNSEMPDAGGVLYQSIGSRMASRTAAPFPLSLGYSLIQPIDGNNDGLVAVSSMPWGRFLGVVEPNGSEGISHGDMIDLSRRDVGDFDVCEHYVQLVNGLRQQGL